MINIIVKCNSALAENLINEKKQEISLLENNFDSNISFIFDGNSALNEPLVDFENNNIGSGKKLQKIDNKTKKKRIVRKIVKKSNISTKNLKKKVKVKSKKKGDLNDQSKVNETLEKIDKDPGDKTGWWA